MYVNVLHEGGACSTVIFFDLGYTSGSFYDQQPKDLDEFFKSFEFARSDAEEYCNFGIDYDSFDDSGYTFDQMGHIVVSTDTAKQPRVEEILEEIGFWKSPKAYNEKNETTCHIWHMTVEAFLEKYHEWKTKSMKSPKSKMTSTTGATTTIAA